MRRFFYWRQLFDSGTQYKMRVVVLVEDSSKVEGVEAEHGLSLYIENGSRRILFDVGKSGLFARNAKTLGIAVNLVETLILSHGHCDHTGGLERFGELNADSKIYATLTTFRPYFSLRRGNVYENIGTPRFDADERFSDRIVFNEGFLKLPNGEILFSDVKTNELRSEANDALFSLASTESGNDDNKRDLTSDNLFRHDSFEHEQNLIVTTETGRNVLFVGCSHRGIVNIMVRCAEILGRAPDVAFGGFHLMSPSRGESIPLNSLDRIAERLACWPTRYYAGHCVGNEAFDRVQRVLRNQISYFGAGETFEF
ncbi:MAG: MBL fold metallo-hydrolase [Thermoguttaceae bacterium]|nr:MBL fold metallo-hydrolase [Thermoguttaceae bacterium]